MTPFAKLLVLDLDETLVYATESALEHPYDGRVGPYLIYLRPGASAFLDWATAAFSDVAVWTSSTTSYAVPLINNLLGGCERLAFVWARNRCTLHFDPETREREYLKDLKKIRRRGYRRNQVIAVDNTPRKWCRSYGNLVRIADFEGDPHDCELNYLRLYLTELGNCRNLRKLEKRGWRRKFANRVD